MVRLLRVVERFVYRRATQILTVTRDARRNLLEKGVAPEKVRVVDNWVDEAMFTPPAPDETARVRRERHWHNRFVVLFAGNIGLVQNLENALAAAGRMSGGENVLLAIMGDGADRERLQRLARESRLEDRVMFIERQPVAAVAPYLGAADALLVTLRRSEVERYVIPSKTLAYLAAGQPLIVAMEGPAAELVRAAGAGLAVAPDDPDALAKAFRTLAALPVAERDAMGRRGRDWAREHYARDTLIAVYETILADVAGVRL